MRYIGNKTRLLPFLLRTIRRLGLRDPHAGTPVVHDAFAGTAAVGRALKTNGWTVASSDMMTMSYVFQQAYVVAERPRTTSLGAIASHLASGLEAEEGFITRHYSPVGGRMYFTVENATRIDAARHALKRWHDAGMICDATYFVLLAALIEGADRVANTAGVYAAWMKRWQLNARRALTVEPVEPAGGAPGATATCDDATAVARRLGEIDLLYVDPPYNTRQYSTYYHIPEIIARGWFDGPIALRGKTGLLPKTILRSAWCSSRRAPGALRDLLAATGARHVLVSYNSDGIVADTTLRRVLAEAAVDGQVRRFAHRYRRYRADSDRDGRQYRRDGLREWLYYARLR